MNWNYTIGIRIISIFFLISSLQGCWFIFIPGSVVGAITDGISGAKGEHCVGNSVKVGDKVKKSDGTVLTIKSLSGTSTRCKESDKPIRAELE
jgi:hypothetical protein